MLPGILGGPNWGGGAFDPETGILYVKTSKQPWIARVTKPAEAHNPHSADIVSDYTQDFGTRSQFHNGLPLVKPPYGILNAVDLNRGSDRVAGAVWRYPVVAQPSCSERCRAARKARCLGRAGTSGY